MIKILIIANCQNALYKSILEYTIEKTVQIDAFQVHLLANKPKEREQWLERASQYDYIFTFNISDKFAPIDTVNLKAEFPNKVIAISNIFFQGLHPDMTYIGAMNKRVSSSLSDYHSKIIFKSFMEKQNCETCIQHFNADTYSNLGYFDEWARSVEVFRERERNVDIPFVDSMLQILKERHSLYTLNHPSVYLLLQYCYMILEHCDIPFYKCPAHYLPDPLSVFIWPVYHELSEYHNLQYKTPILFKSRGMRLMTLREFVQASYKHYEDISLVNDDIALAKYNDFF